jgi:hypothetical protein
LGDVLANSSGADFSYIFSGENSAENFAENFPPKMLGKKRIFRGKSFEKSFFHEIPRKIRRKVIFRGKKCTKNRPLMIRQKRGRKRRSKRDNNLFSEETRVAQIFLGTRHQTGKIYQMTAKYTEWP